MFIEIQIPVYKKEKYVATDLGLNSDINHDVILTLIDDSVDQNLVPSDIKIDPSVGFRILKNGRNKGSFNSRMYGLANSIGDVVVPLDDDDLLIQENIKHCADILWANRSHAGILFPKHHWCKEQYCTKEQFNNRDTISLAKAPLIKCIGPVHTVILGEFIRPCINQFLESGLIEKLYELVGTERICLLEDYYAMSWMRPYMYNNHIGKMDVWIPIHYYYDFARTNDYDGTNNSVVDYSSPDLAKLRDTWYNDIIRSYWKW